jgi:hypothetical protein
VPSPRCAASHRPHPQAATTYRETIIAPFLVTYAKKQGKTLDLTKVKDELNALHGTQLVSTLTYLSPVNTLRTYAVTVNVA